VQGAQLARLARSLAFERLRLGRAWLPRFGFFGRHASAGGGQVADLGVVGFGFVRGHVGSPEKRLVTLAAAPHAPRHPDSYLSLPEHIQAIPTQFSLFLEIPRPPTSPVWSKNLPHPRRIPLRFPPVPCSLSW